MNTQRFAGKVMVVTGAAQGIGRGVALGAAAEGAKVLFVDRAEFVSEVAAEASAAEIIIGATRAKSASLIHSS